MGDLVFTKHVHWSDNGVELVESEDYAAMRKLLVSSERAYRFGDGSLVNPTQTLATGAAIESWTGDAVVSVSADTSHFRIGTQGVKLTTSGAGTGYAYIDPLPPADPVPTNPAQAVCLWAYADIGSRATVVQAIMYTATGLGTYVSGSHNVALANGWNFLRLPLGDSTLTTWPNGIYRLTIRLTATAAVNVTIGHVYLECPKKSRAIIVADGAYQTFCDLAWPELQNRKWPVTWAVNPDKFGNTGGIKDTISLVNFNALLASDQAGDEVSLHSWTRAEMAAMTAAQVREDTYKCVRFVQSHWPERYVPWRAAWTSNTCAQHAVVQDMFLCYATPTASTGKGIMWPPNMLSAAGATAGNKRYDMYRWGVMNDAALTNVESRIRDAHISHIFYFHGISTGVDPTNDATPEYLATWLALMDQYVASGDLEVTSMGRLLEGLGVYDRPVRAGRSYMLDVNDDTSAELNSDLDANGNTIHFGTAENEATISTTPSPNTCTVNLGAENHWTIPANDADDSINATIIMPPGPCGGTIFIEQGTTPRDITWLPAESVVWLGTEPTWTDASEASEFHGVSWRYNGTYLFLSDAGKTSITA